MKNKKDKNSKTAQLEQARTARLGLAQWPVHGPALPQDPAQALEIEGIFQGIVAGRPADGWSSTDLLRACHLAVLLQTQNDNITRLALAGPLSKNKRGSAVVSPLVYVNDKIGQSIASLTRQLGLNAQHMGADPRTARQENEEFRKKYGDHMAGGTGAGAEVITLKGLLDD